MLNEYFQLKKKKNKEFTFQIEINNKNRLTHYFQVDTTFQITYAYFGDTIIFDMTYNTNQCDMIFGHILGVNNYFQTTIF